MKFNAGKYYRDKIAPPLPPPSWHIPFSIEEKLRSTGEHLIGVVGRPVSLGLLEVDVFAGRAELLRLIVPRGQGVGVRD